nr:MltR family transcriptional regulator [Bradyrhizobium sp. JYMT SZCCT0180]
MINDGARGSILAGTSLIEDVLEGAISHTFSHLSKNELKELFEGTAPLSTFSAKIKIAYAIGVVGPMTRHDLEKLRELSNAFAHSARHLTFELPEIASIVRSLNALKDVKGGEGYKVQHQFVESTTLLMWVLVGKMRTPVAKVQGIDHLD